MPSEQRLHPASIVFAFAKSARSFLLPGLLVLFSVGRSSGGAGGQFGHLPANWELWLMLLMIPSGVAAIARYISYRIRYEGTEIVIRSGILFRNERHIPYARIQNLDAVQNLVHRLVGVIEVRVETGGGREPEARISVLPEQAFAEMRRRVFEGRGQALPAPASDERGDTQAEQPRTLLHLGLRDVLLFGFLENRGFIAIGAAYGAAWEMDLFETFWGDFFQAKWFAPYLVPTRAFQEMMRGGFSITLAFVLLAGLGGLVIVARLISMAWGAVRFYDFHLTRAGNDLHTTYGLLTRVATTIPSVRVQTLTVRQSPLYRFMKRFSVQVETAGGQHGSDRGRRERVWLAPLIRDVELPRLLREMLPEVDVPALDWQPPHPRAFRRAVRPPLALALLLTASVAALAGWWSLALLPLALTWAMLVARKYVDNLGWVATDQVVAFRSGWLWKSTTLARVAKIQAVTQLESPFDRRATMRRLRIDTAGAGERSHRVDIPYLARETAAALSLKLAERAAQTAFSTR